MLAQGPSPRGCCRFFCLSARSRHAKVPRMRAGRPRAFRELQEPASRAVMKTRGAQLGCVVCCGVLSLLGCEDEKPAAPAKSTAPVATPAATPTPSAAAAAAPKAEKASERPSKVDTELSPARRAAVEAKYPSAKGFLVASDLQAKLKANKSLKDKKAAITAFDKLARGKWVLFSGPLVNATDDAFDIGLEYTPQLPNDPMGMSRQFFEVTMSQIEGYHKEDFKGGNVGVVLVKYNGAAKATPGYELVAAGVWK